MSSQPEMKESTLGGFDQKGAPYSGRLYISYKDFTSYGRQDKLSTQGIQEALSKHPR